LYDERLIIERAKKDPEAFGVLVEHHYPAIFGYIHRRVQGWTDTQDLTSEVFFKAFKGFWRYRWQGIPFSAWLFRIATNEIRMYFRRGRRPNVSLNQLMEEHGFEPADPQTLNAEKLEAETRLKEYEDFLSLQSRILELPLKYQEVIMLRYFEKKSVREIAQILARKEGTVKSLLSRGIGRLRVLLG
jgi:RNA polymerase sigma-70 factor (ECF subfamily)